MKSPIAAEICDGKCTRIVHTNRLRYCYVLGQHDTVEDVTKKVERTAERTDVWTGIYSLKSAFTTVLYAPAQ